MKYKDVFELEQGINDGVTSKSWPLLKRLAAYTRMLSVIIEPIRARVQTPETVKQFQSALNRLKAQNAGLPEEELQKKITELVIEHKDAQLEALQQLELDKEISNDDIPEDEIPKLVPIPESLLHEKDHLSISPRLYMTLNRLGLIEDDSNKDKKKEEPKKDDSN